jgi:hypothetical protein
MKKIIIVLALFTGLSYESVAQSAGGSGAEKVSSGSGGGGGRSRRASRSGQIKPRKQMRHFESRRADPNIKNNGTSYRMKRRKEMLEAEGNGFGASNGKK